MDSIYTCTLLAILFVLIIGTNSRHWNIEDEEANIRAEAHMRITEGDAGDIEHRLIGLAALLSGDNGSSRERSHSNRKQLFKLVRKVILRHACVKMDSKQIMNTLREGREMNHENKREMRGIRRSLDRKAMLCRLRRVKFLPDENPDSVPGPIPLDTSVGGEVTVHERPESRTQQNKHSRRAAGEGTQHALCSRGDTKWGRAKLMRMKTRMRNLRCWTRTARRSYHYLLDTANADGTLAQHTHAQKCKLLREYGNCVNTRLGE